MSGILRVASLTFFAGLSRTSNVRPVTLILLRRFWAIFVFGGSLAKPEMTLILPSRFWAERAEIRAFFFIFLGSVSLTLRAFGPKTIPPPTKRGERLEPARARPVCF